MKIKKKLLKYIVIDLMHIWMAIIYLLLEYIVRLPLRKDYPS